MSSKGGGFFSSLFGSSKSKSKDDTVSESVENPRSKEDPVVEIKSEENTEESVTEESNINIDNFQKSEVSAVRWLLFEECNKKIRENQKEKKKNLEKINKTIKSLRLI